MIDVSEDTSGFGVPVNSHAGHGAHSDFWDIPPVVYDVVFIGEVSDHQQ